MLKKKQKKSVNSAFFSVTFMYNRMVEKKRKGVFPLYMYVCTYVVLYIY